jgi:hypothetical protein
MADDRRTSVVDEARLRVTSIFTKTGDHAVVDHAVDSDEEVLVALGYKQEFKRCVNPPIQVPNSTFSSAQRSLHLVLLLCVFLRAWTSPLYRLDLDLQPGLLGPSRLGLGLDCRGCLDSICRALHGRTMQ